MSIRSAEVKKIDSEHILEAQAHFGEACRIFLFGDPIDARIEAAHGISVLNKVSDLSRKDAIETRNALRGIIRRTI